MFCSFCYYNYNAGHQFFSLGVFSNRPALFSQCQANSCVLDIPNPILSTLHMRVLFCAHLDPVIKYPRASPAHCRISCRRPTNFTQSRAHTKAASAFAITLQPTAKWSAHVATRCRHHALGRSIRSFSPSYAHLHDHVPV